MLTSYWAMKRKIDKDSGLICVSISRFPPYWAGEHVQFDALAPTPEMLKDKNRFTTNIILNIGKYLENLDQHQVWSEIHNHM